MSVTAALELESELRIEAHVKELYHNGRFLLHEIDLFAFPRAGSHFLFHVLSGLFDLVDRDHPHLRNAEAIARQEELDPMMLYALDLREDGVPFQPIFVNPRATGMHGVPAKGNNRALLLIREPVATAYSLYRANRDRWGLQLPELPLHIKQTLEQYAAFYDTGLNIVLECPMDFLLLRWEDLVRDPDTLRRVVEFVGIRPKLNCEFVHHITRFGSMVRPAARTFYRQGDNSAWKQDAAWTAALAASAHYDFTRFGYTTIESALAG